MISEKLMLKGYTVTCIRKSMHTICQLTIIFPLLIIGQIDNFPTAILLVCIAIGGANIHCACLSVNPQDLAPEFAGSLFGLMNTAGAIPGFIGVYFAGYVQDVTGSWQAVFCVTAMINVIGAIVFLFFGSGKPIVKSSSTLVSHAIIS
ncbi:SLC17A9 (predicted) [Pycnogonum litorale]